LVLSHEVLENYIAKKVGYTGTIDDSAAARAAIGAYVYERTLTLKGQPGDFDIGDANYDTTVSQSVRSFQQPFYLPIARIASYLAALGSSWPAAAKAVGAAPAVRAQAELGLSAAELLIVTTPETDLTHLSTLYTLPFAVKTPPGTGELALTDPAGGPQQDIDASRLYPPMGLTRADLGQLVAAFFVAAGGATVKIVPSKKDATSVQNDVEKVTGLTADALDRMHRLTRLARRTGWAISDLDLALRTLALGANPASGPLTILSLLAHALARPEDVEAVAALHALQARFGLSIGDLCALVGPIPTTPQGTSLFDQLFNAPSSVVTALALPASTVTPLPQMAARLLSALGVDPAGLDVLVRNLATPIGATQGANGWAFAPSLGNLTLLYRHARLARMLGLGIDDLFQLLGLTGAPYIVPAILRVGPDGNPISTTPYVGLGLLNQPAGWPPALANLPLLLDFYDWWKGSGYTLDDIAFATQQPVRDLTKYLDPGAVARQVVEAASSALTFTDTAFSVALGISEQGSRDLLASLSTVSAPLWSRNPRSTGAGASFPASPSIPPRSSG
jgi:hypothetical protein